MLSTCLAFLLWSAPGAHHQKPATTPYSCHDVLADRFTFSLNLSRSSFISNSDPHRNLSNQWHSLSRTDVTWDRIVFILTEVCSCVLELAYFAGKTYKNRLVHKNIVALAHYWNCDRAGLTLLSDVLPRELFRLCSLCSTCMGSRLPFLRGLAFLQWPLRR